MALRHEKSGLHSSSLMSSPLFICVEIHKITKLIFILLLAWTDKVVLVFTFSRQLGHMTWHLPHPSPLLLFMPLLLLYLLPDCSNIQGILPLLTMCVSCHRPMVMKSIENYQCWFPHVVTGKKNSPTGAHAGHERRLQWVLPGALDYSWTPSALGVINRLGDRPTSCHHKKANY